METSGENARKEVTRGSKMSGESVLRAYVPTQVFSPFISLSSLPPQACLLPLHKPVIFRLALDIFLHTKPLFSLAYSLHTNSSYLRYRLSLQTCVFRTCCSDIATTANQTNTPVSSQLPNSQQSARARTRSNELLYVNSVFTIVFVRLPNLSALAT